MQITITTYKELEGYIQLFKQGVLEILIIEGNPGIGKSSLVKEIFKDISSTEICFLEGRISAASLYEQLYLYRDCPIILDDCDALYTDKQSINLLKQLCQTNKDKRIQWYIKRKLTLTQDPTVELPSSFYTGSAICILCNQWELNNKHIESIEDRGILLKFHPSNNAIHEYVSGIISDIDVLSFFKRYLHIITNLSIRQYVICQNIKQSSVNSNINWKDVAIGSWGIGNDFSLFIQIHEDNTFHSDHERAIEFSRKSQKSLRTWNRIRDELRVQVYMIASEYPYTSP